MIYLQEKQKEERQKANGFNGIKNIQEDGGIQAAESTTRAITLWKNDGFRVYHLISSAKQFETAT